MNATIRWKGWVSLSLGAWLCLWWLVSPYPINEAASTMVGALAAALGLWHLHDEISWDEGETAGTLT